MDQEMLYKKIKNNDLNGISDILHDTRMSDEKIKNIVKSHKKTKMILFNNVKKRRKNK